MLFSATEPAFILLPKSSGFLPCQPNLLLLPKPDPFDSAAAASPAFLLPALQNLASIPPNLLRIRISNSAPVTPPLSSPRSSPGLCVFTYTFHPSSVIVVFGDVGDMVVGMEIGLNRISSILMDFEWETQKKELFNHVCSVMMVPKEREAEKDENDEKEAGFQLMGHVQHAKVLVRVLAWLEGRKQTSFLALQQPQLATSRRLKISSFINVLIICVWTVMDALLNIIFFP